MRGVVRRTMIGAALLAMGALSACSAPVLVVTAGLTVAQSRTDAYVNGALKSALPVPIERVDSAALAALGTLEFKFLKRRVEGREIVIVCEELGGRNFTVSMVKKSPEVTKVSIRFGTFGDQAMSRLVMSHILKQIDAANPAHDPLAEALDELAP